MERLPDSSSSSPAAVHESPVGSRPAPTREPDDSRTEVSHFGSGRGGGAVLTRTSRLSTSLSRTSRPSPSTPTPLESPLSSSARRHKISSSHTSRPALLHSATPPPTFSPSVASRDSGPTVGSDNSTTAHSSGSCAASTRLPKTSNTSPRSYKVTQTSQRMSAS